MGLLRRFKYPAHYSWRVLKGTTLFDRVEKKHQHHFCCLGAVREKSGASYRLRPGCQHATCTNCHSPLPCRAASCYNLNQYLGLTRQKQAGSSWILCTTTLPRRANTEGLGMKLSGIIKRLCAILIASTLSRSCGSLGHIFSGMGS